MPQAIALRADSESRRRANRAAAYATRPRMGGGCWRRLGTTARGTLRRRSAAMTRDSSYCRFGCMMLRLLIGSLLLTDERATRERHAQARGAQPLRAAIAGGSGARGACYVLLGRELPARRRACRRAGRARERDHARPSWCSWDECTWWSSYVPAHLLLQVASSCGRATVPGRHPIAQAISPICPTSRTGRRLRVERPELARLQLALDLGVDLVLGRVGIGVAQLPRAHA